MPAAVKGLERVRGSWWIVAAIVAVLLTLIVTALYGVATGDFAILKTIAESARDVFVEVAAKSARSFSE